MVKNPGKTSSIDTLQPVNTPQPAAVAEGPSGLPTAMRMGRRQDILVIADRWRIDDEWWRTEPVSRLYYALQVKSGQRFVIYKDLVDGRWYRQSL